MSARAPAEFLGDILSYAREAVGFAAGHTRGSFDEDRRTVYAVEWAIVVIGEATKRLPADLRDRRPDIPWRSIAAMRDRLVHGYFAIDYKYVWETVANDLPALIPVVEQLRNELLAEQPPEAPV